MWRVACDESALVGAPVVVRWQVLLNLQYVGAFQIGVGEQTTLKKYDLTACVPRQIASEDVGTVTPADHVHDVPRIADVQRRRLADGDERSRRVHGCRRDAAAIVRSVHARA